MSALNLKTGADFEDDIFEYFSPEEERRVLKTTPMFKSTMALWNKGHNSPDRCGAVMDMLREVPKGAELEAFYDVYFDTMGGSRIWRNIDLWCGSLAESDDWLFDPNVTAEAEWKFAVDSYLRRVLDDSFEGRIGEKMVFEGLAADRLWRQHRIRYANKHEDCDLGVDIVISQFSQIACGIQVKPPSYFSRFASPTQLKARHEGNPKKYAAFTKETGAPAMYCNIGDLYTPAGRVKLIPVADVAEGRYIG